MTDRDLEFDWGSWLRWGGLAGVVLIAMVLFFVWLGAQGDDGDEVEPAEQVEWTIDVTSELAPAPGEITLKGDLPYGFPTETWKDGVQLARTVSAEPWEWNMDASPEVPLPVYEIDQAGSCDGLGDLLREWAEATGNAAGPARRAEAEAFAQYAFNTMVEQGCEIPET